MLATFDSFSSDMSCISDVIASGGAPPPGSREASCIGTSSSLGGDGGLREEFFLARSRRERRNADIGLPLFPIGSMSLGCDDEAGSRSKISPIMGRMGVDRLVGVSFGSSEHS